MLRSTGGVAKDRADDPENSDHNRASPPVVLSHLSVQPELASCGTVHNHSENKLLPSISLCRSAFGMRAVGILSLGLFGLCWVGYTVYTLLHLRFPGHFIPDTHFEHVRLALWFPFTHAEIPDVRLAVQQRWQHNLYTQSRVRVCSGAFTADTDLIFAYNKDHMHAAVYYEIQALLEDVRDAVGHCFGKIEVLSYKLTDEEDGMHPSGTNHMVYHTLVEPDKYLMTLGRPYDHLQIMYTDIYAVQDNWLDAVYKQVFTGDDFWIKGSYFQGHDWDELINEEQWVKENFDFWGYHINGAGLYNLQDAGFKLFIERTMNTFKSDRYDIALAKERMVESCLDPKHLEHMKIIDDPLRCLRFRQANLGKFLYAEYIQMRGSAIFDQNTRVEVLAQPTTYLVRGTVVTEKQEPTEQSNSTSGV